MLKEIKTLDVPLMIWKKLKEINVISLNKFPKFDHFFE
jgi:hypothetical protein